MVQTKVLTLGRSVLNDKQFEISLARAATKKLGVVGISGSGKTHNSAVLVEQFIRQGVPVVIFDPVGRWWDLGISADGKGKGLPIAVIGGQRGQIELTPEMGGAIARYVAEMRVPTVIDLSQMRSKSHWRQVVADFGNTLFEINHAPVHLVIEEAPEFVPQRVMESVAGVYGAMDKLIRIGRNKGIGMTLIAQRPQMINKDALSQVNALIVMRLTDPGSIDAARDWLDAQGAESDLVNTFIGRLPALADGTGLVLSPAWLKTFDCVQFHRRETFHYDPEADEDAFTATGNIAQAVDTDSLQKAFAKFIPAKTQLTKSSRVEAAIVERAERLQKENDELRTALETQQADTITDEDVQQQIALAVNERDAQIAKLTGALAAINEQIKTALGGESAAESASLPSHMASANRVTALVQKASEKLDKTEKKILETLGDLYPMFPSGVRVEQLAVESRYSANGGAFGGALARLAKRRLIVRASGMIRFNPDLLR